MTARRSLLLAGALAACAAFSPAARAEPEPLSADARRRAERAFVVGRLDDLDAILGASAAPVDREPLAVRRRFWRPSADADPTPMPDDASVSSRRLRWLAGWPGTAAGAYPMPTEGEPEPYPVLTALVLDRLRREARGVAGLPADGPLAKVQDETVQAFLVATGHLLGGPTPPAAAPAPDAPPDPDAVLAERTAALARRNAGVAAAAGAAFLLLTGLLGWLVGRRR